MADPLETLRTAGRELLESALEQMSNDARLDIALAVESGAEVLITVALGDGAVRAVLATPDGGRKTIFEIG